MENVEIFTLPRRWVRKTLMSLAISSWNSFYDESTVAQSHCTMQVKPLAAEISQRNVVCDLFVIHYCCVEISITLFNIIAGTPRCGWTCAHSGKFLAPGSGNACKAALFNVLWCCHWHLISHWWRWLPLHGLLLCVAAALALGFQHFSSCLASIYYNSGGFAFNTHI